MSMHKFGQVAMNLHVPQIMQPEPIPPHWTAHSCSLSVQTIPSILGQFPFAPPRNCRQRKP
jgi:hypothetical protein